MRMWACMVLPFKVAPSLFAASRARRRLWGAAHDQCGGVVWYDNRFITDSKCKR